MQRMWKSFFTVIQPNHPQVVNTQASNRLPAHDVDEPSREKLIYEDTLRPSMALCCKTVIYVERLKISLQLPPLSSPCSVVDLPSCSSSPRVSCSSSSSTPLLPEASCSDGLMSPTFPLSPLSPPHYESVAQDKSTMRRSNISEHFTKDGSTSLAPNSPTLNERGQ